MAESITSVDPNTTKELTKKKLRSGIKGSFFLTPYTPNEIINIIDSLSSKKHQEQMI